MDTSKNNSDAVYSTIEEQLNKRSYQEEEDYTDKRLRLEKFKLTKSSSSRTASTSYNVESLALKLNQHGLTCKDDEDEELESINPSTSGLQSKVYNVESSAPKKTLHGITYQLRLLMLFVQRVPEGQEFFLSTEMHEAGLFNDIVLQYLGTDGIWRYRFLQAKHIINDKFKIKSIDLFNKKLKSKEKNQSSEAKPYLLKKYFKSYCDIEQNGDFKNALLEEFLICTNVDFGESAMTYFEFDKENNNDPIFGNRVKYRLTEKKISELKKEFEINQNESCLLTFVEKFRFLTNYEDNELNENIENCLKKNLKIRNIDLADAYLKNRVLKWFESYKDKKSRYLHIKDKIEFLKSLNNNINSLLVAGYSTFYIEELKSYEVQFENTSLLRKFFTQKGKMMYIITESPKLSIIKTSQLFEELELGHDEVILTNTDQLNYNRKIFPTFFSEPSYKWLVIECHNEIKLDREILKKILQMDNEKTVIIIGREDNVLKLNKCLRLIMPSFNDKDNLFDDLTISSQEKVLERPVIFQGHKVILKELINIYSARSIIDKLTLEKLLTKTVKIGNNDAFISHFLIEDCYIQRTLIERKLRLDILQNEEILKNCLFIISGLNRNELRNLNINNEWIHMWEDGRIPNNGIIISTTIDSNDIFNKLSKYDRKDVCWLEYIKGKFLIRNIRNETTNLYKHIICLKEHELDTKQILEKKIIIVADGPGCGKSMFMTRVARQLRQIMSNIWVLRINISSYAYKQKKQRQVMKSLKDINFICNETKRAIEFMADLLFPEENESENNHFVRELLTQSLYCVNKNMKFPKIIFLFDGFDEISPTFKEKTLTLLQALRNSNVAQIWITTRNHEELSLEIALHSSAFFLKPLDYKEKVDFLQKFWKYNLVNFDNIEPTPDSEVLTYLTEITDNICNFHNYSINASLLNFRKYLLRTPSYSELQLFINSINFSIIAERLLYYFEYGHGDKITEFTGNPLQLKMLAEMIVFKKFSALDKLDKFSLYEEFIKYKWRVFRDDKDAAGKSVAGHKSFETYLQYLIM